MDWTRSAPRSTRGKEGGARSFSGDENGSVAQGYGQEPFFGLSVKYHLPPDINLMQQPDEIIQDAVPATSGHVLKIALVASVLLHLVVLAVWKMPPSPESTVAKRTLHISLTSQPSLNQPTGEISQAIEQHPPVPPSLPSKEVSVVKQMEQMSI